MKLVGEIYMLFSFVGDIVEDESVTLMPRHGHGST